MVAVEIPMLTLDQIFSSQYSAYFVAFVLGAFALSGKLSVNFSEFFLFLAWVMVALGLRDQPWPHIVGFSAIAGGALVLLGSWFHPNTPPPPPIDLTQNEGVLSPENTSGTSN